MRTASLAGFKLASPAESVVSAPRTRQPRLLRHAPRTFSAGLGTAEAPPDIAVSLRDQAIQGFFIQFPARAQLHMTHALARAFEQAGRIGKHRAEIKANVRMGFERVDVSERRIPDARNGTAVVQQLANVGAAAAASLRPPSN